jgi:5-formyltetrahydrofolate cyclo-ligase
LQPLPLIQQSVELVVSPEREVSMPSIAPATKAALRERLRVRLGEIDPAVAAAAADRVAEKLLALPEIARAERILTCLSFGTEIDTWRLVERLLAEGRALFVPRADPRDRRLHVHPYPCPLHKLPFGLRQPPRGAPEVAESAIDGAVQALLVLGLAFDRRGFRLGHGSGYFDRFLARRPFPAIGLAYAAQLLDELPTEPHDIPMAVVVTEAEVCRPRPAPTADSPR